MNNPGTIAHPVTVVEMTTVISSTPITSKAIPVRRTRTGPMRWARGAPTPLATKDPTANANKMTPVCNASYPMTDCRNRGSVNSSPNSPRLTRAATRLPTPNVRIRKSLKSTRTVRLAAARLFSTQRNTSTRSTPPNSPTAAGDTLSKGHCQPPIWNGFLAASHP